LQSRALVRLEKLLKKKLGASGLQGRIVLHLGFHAGKNGLELLELRVSVERLQAWIGQRLEEPGTAQLVGGMQIRDCRIEIAESHVDCRNE